MMPDGPSDADAVTYWERALPIGRCAAGGPNSPDAALGCALSPGKGLSATGAAGATHRCRGRRHTRSDRVINR